MAERWLYGVDGGLTEPGPESWEPDPWGEGVAPGRDLGSLTECLHIDRCLFCLVACVIGCICGSIESIGRAVSLILQLTESRLCLDDLCG